MGYGASSYLSVVAVHLRWRAPLTEHRRCISPNDGAIKCASAREMGGDGGLT